MIHPLETSCPSRFATLFLALACAAAEPSREPVTFADGNVPSRQIFLSPEGNDSTGRGTETAPYRTLGRATQEAQPGTAVRLLPGTYGSDNYLSGISGTAEAPIWIGGLPGRSRPVISGGSTALQLSRVRYLVVEHLEIAGSTANGINCDDGGRYADPDATRYVLFRNLRIRDIGTGGNNDCLKLSGVNDYWVLDCEFVGGSSGGSGIDHVGCHRGVIARCQFETMGSNAIQCKGGSAEIDIQWCHFKNGGARAINLGGSTGFQFFRPPLSTTEPNVEAREIRVVANLFEGSDAPVAYVGCVDCLVAHNTIVTPTRWVARILQETTSSGGYEFLPCGRSRFLNNLVYFARTNLSAFVNVGPNTDSGSFTFAHNLWYAYDAPNRSTPNLPVAETDGISGQDPRFRQAASGDFTLLPGSPAIGKGVSLPEAPADRAQRGYANPPSIGAHEASPTPPQRSDADTMPDWWEHAYGFNPLDSGDGDLDLDQDQASNNREYLAGTDPADAQSTLKISAVGIEGLEIWWRFPTTSTRRYFAEAGASVPFGPWNAIASLSGDGTLREIRHPVTSLPGATFFRVRCEFLAGE